MSGSVLRKSLLNMIQRMDSSLVLAGCTTNVNHFAPGVHTSPPPQMQSILELQTWANGVESLSQANFLKESAFFNYSNDRLILLDYAVWISLYAVCSEEDKLKLLWKKNAVHDTTLMGLKHSKTFPPPPKLEHNFLGRMMMTKSPITLWS